MPSSPAGHALPRAIAKRVPFFYGWIVVAVAFVTLGLGANARGTFGLLFPSILKEFGWDRGDTSFIFSLGFLVAACFAPVIGYAIDRFGPHRVLPFGTVLLPSRPTQIRLVPEHVGTDRLQMRAPPLDLLRHRVDVAEPPFEIPSPRDRRRPRRVPDDVG